MLKLLIDLIFREKEILNVGGTIISECLLEMKLNKYNFFARNRIISGLSDGVVVVEAKKKVEN